MVLLLASALSQTCLCASLWVRTQQTITGCTTTFINLLVLNTTPDCNCTENTKHTFFSFIACIPTWRQSQQKVSFCWGIFRKWNQQGQQKKRSFRGRATAVFLEDKGPNPEWDFVDGCPCSENYWCSSRKEEKYSFVRAVDQKCSNWSQNVKM